MEAHHMMTQGRARQILKESEYAPGFDVWLHTHTGYIPAMVSEDTIAFPWEVVLEHGKIYVRHIQDWHHPKEMPLEDRAKKIEEQVKLVGGNFPW